MRPDPTQAPAGPGTRCTHGTHDGGWLPAGRICEPGRYLCMPKAVQGGPAGQQRSGQGSRVIDVDGCPVRLCGTASGGLDPQAEAALAEVVRAARRRLEQLPPRCLAQPPTPAGQSPRLRPPCLQEPDHEGRHRDFHGREW